MDMINNAIIIAVSSFSNIFNVYVTVQNVCPFFVRV